MDVPITIPWGQKADPPSFLCSVTGKSLGQDFRLHIEISQGLPYIDYEALAKKHHLSAMELKVRKLEDEIERVRAISSFSMPSSVHPQEAASEALFSFGGDDSPFLNRARIE